MQSINSLPQIVSLNGYSQIESVLLVGCGGNGGHLAPHLCRFINVINQTREENDKIRLFFADGDVVEQKNLLRQHFISQDITKNKASVLAERYSAAFGMQIGVVTKDLENIGDFGFFANSARDLNRADLVIGCVDNVNSRKLINEWFTNSPNEDGFHWRSRFWIDAGNEERTGQVICAYSPSSRATNGSEQINVFGELTQTEGEFSLPSVIEVYPELLSDEGVFNSELSCAERAEAAPQNMQTNVTAATLIMNYAQKLILCEPLNSHGVEFSIDNRFSTKLNTLDNLSKVSEDRRRHWEK